MFDGCVRFERSKSIAMELGAKNLDMEGFGWVARDCEGKGAGVVGNILCISNLMAEAEAIQASLRACVEKGFEVMQLEIDSNNLVDMINEIMQANVNIEGILLDIL